MNKQRALRVHCVLDELTERKLRTAIESAPEQAFEDLFLIQVEPIVEELIDGPAVALRGLDHVVHAAKRPPVALLADVLPLHRPRRLLLEPADPFTKHPLGVLRRTGAVNRHVVLWLQRRMNVSVLIPVGAGHWAQWFWPMADQGT